MLAVRRWLLKTVLSCTAEGRRTWQGRAFRIESSGYRGSLQEQDKPVAIAPGRGRALWSVVLTAAGLGLFVYLVHGSGCTLAMLGGLGWQSFGLLVAVSAAVIALDTVAWYFAVRHVARPAALPLFGLRVAGDSLTNAVPGGVVLGETYKASLLRRWYGVSLSDNAASLLTVKFGLGFSQAIFVLAGIALCHGLLRDRSQELLGFAGAHYASAAMTLGFGLLMLLPLVAMLRGHPFSACANALARLPLARLRGWIEARRERIAYLDERCSAVLHRNRKNLAAVFLALLAGWLVSSLESYVLLAALGLGPTLRTAYVIESVGSMFRLIFFIVPSGIGGQDASLMALFKLYRLPASAAGIFVLVKRFKELLWIGTGFLLIVLFRRAPGREPLPAATAPLPSREPLD
jgi:uncharacterized protein (TIRG00374 family)